MSLNGKRAPASPSMMKNATTAPVIYFDGIPVFGALQNIIELELSARMMQPRSDGSVQADMVCTAHLRCSHAAAQGLRDAIDKALELYAHAPQQQDKTEEHPTH
jgi:hypothetical protein